MPSTSSKQANIFRMAYAVRKGLLERSKVDKPVLDIVDGDMSDSQIKHFTQVKESKISLSNYITEAWSGVKKQSYEQEIKSWCEEMGIERYTINDKGEIDVDGSVDLNCKDIKELPYKFGIVDRMFSLSGNKNLTSLKNCPNFVGNMFSCSLCSQLDSLEGCPKKVMGNFYCNGCKHEFTKEEVQSLCNVKKTNIRV